MVYIHNGVLFSKKEKRISSFAEKWVEWEIIFSKRSQIQTNTIFSFHMWNSHIYVHDKKVEKVLAGRERDNKKA